MLAIKHLFKVPLELSDMMIRGLDLDTQIIEYQIVDKTGKAMEPIKKDKFILHNNEIIFDKNRSLSIQFAEYISEILNS